MRRSTSQLVGTTVEGTCLSHGVVCFELVYIVLVAHVSSIFANASKTIADDCHPRTSFQHGTIA